MINRTDISTLGVARRGWIVRYAVGIFVPALALLAQAALRPYLLSISHYLLFPAVFFVMFVAGFGPGCLAVLVAAFGADYYFVKPWHEIKIFSDLSSALRFLLFAGSSFFTAWLIRRTQIFEQKLTEQLLVKTESEEKFQLMANSAPVMVWISNTEKLCTWFNQGWLDFVGHSLKQELGNGWTNGIHPSDLDRCLKTYQVHFETRQAFFVEYRLMHSSGEYRWISGRGIPRYDSTGIFEGFIGACMDIHEQKRLQEQSKKTAEKLEQAVRVRDDFLSIASHELKTPLTSMKLQVQQMLRALEKGDEKSYTVERVRLQNERTDKQITRLTRLVDDMLDVSRISTGKLGIEKERFDLGALVTDVVDRLQQQFSENLGQQPTLLLCEKSDGYWDKLRIDQVIVNLLTNAIRYGNRKPVQVEITCEENLITLAVRDQGIGISPENMERIFNRFERAVSSSEISGLGLGLFISSMIVSAHGGSIWAESELGKGSTFYVSLPRN